MLQTWNNCYCYCLVCKTYLKYCHQAFYNEMGTYEYDLAIIIPLGFSLIIFFWSNFSLYYIMEELKLDEPALKLLKVR